MPADSLHFLVPDPGTSLFANMDDQGSIVIPKGHVMRTLFQGLSLFSVTADEDSTLPYCVVFGLLSSVCAKPTAAVIKNRLAARFMITPDALDLRLSKALSLGLPVTPYSLAAWREATETVLLEIQDEDLIDKGHDGEWNRLGLNVMLQHATLGLGDHSCRFMHVWGDLLLWTNSLIKPEQVAPDSDASQIFDFIMHAGSDTLARDSHVFKLLPVQKRVNKILDLVYNAKLPVCMGDPSPGCEDVFTQISERFSWWDSSNTQVNRRLIFSRLSTIMEHKNFSVLKVFMGSHCEHPNRDLLLEKLLPAAHRSSGSPLAMASSVSSLTELEQLAAYLARKRPSW